MGSFTYDAPRNSFQIDDRTIAHLRIVVMNKLRRSEPFMFDLQMADGSGRRSFWLSPGVALQFRTFSTAPVTINRSWIEALMAGASGPDGLVLVPEPDDRHTTRKPA